MVLAIDTLWICPAWAAGVDCGRAHDPATQAICADPQLLALDAQLSSAYADVLERIPSRAGDLTRDEIHWLGERNREMWWLQQGRRKYPSSASDSDAQLAHFYQLRIAFLRNVDNPDATRNLPIAQQLIASAATLPAGQSDTLKALQANGVVVLPEEHEAHDPAATERMIAMLAAPPDTDLRAALDEFQFAGFTVVYLPSAGLGGAYTIEGTADCQYWVLFEKRGGRTALVAGSAKVPMGGCVRDDGSTGYLALIHGEPVALTVIDPPAVADVADLQWQRWLGGGTWGPAIRLRLRYDYGLGIHEKAYCPMPSRQCALTAGPALHAATRYTRDAFALAASAEATTEERTRFEQMVRQVPDRKIWASCSYPVWFPARIGGRLVVGAITESHIGCHPQAGGLEVGFWGTRDNGTGWWSADNTVAVERHNFLFAARISPTGNL